MAKNIQLVPAAVDDSRLQPNHEPLYKRLPTRDQDGNFLSDFMMLLPGLKQLAAAPFQARLELLQDLLGRHRDVVFVDLNTPLNLLWVSVKARPGVINELVAQIRARIPEARLVGHLPTIKSAGANPPDTGPGRRDRIADKR